MIIMIIISKRNRRNNGFAIASGTLQRNATRRNGRLSPQGFQMMVVSAIMEVTT